MDRLSLKLKGADSEERRGRDLQHKGHDTRKEVSSRMCSLSWIRSLFQELHGHQQKSLAFFVDALLVEQRVGLAHIARRAAGQRDGTLRAALKRLWRFLGNPRFKDDIVSAGLIDWIWPRIRQWKYVPISIDWTHNERRDPWATVTASISL